MKSETKIMLLMKILQKKIFLLNYLLMNIFFVVVYFNNKQCKKIFCDSTLFEIIY